MGETYNDAARRILASQTKKQPMSFRDIWQQMVNEGAVVSRGKTPEQSLYSVMYYKSQKRHTNPTYWFYGKGMFGLADWQK